MIWNNHDDSPLIVGFIFDFCTCIHFLTVQQAHQKDVCHTCHEAKSQVIAEAQAYKTMLLVATKNCTKPQFLGNCDFCTQFEVTSFSELLISAII